MFDSLCEGVCKKFGLDIEALVVGFAHCEICKFLGKHSVHEERHRCALVLKGNKNVKRSEDLF